MSSAFNKAPNDRSPDDLSDAIAIWENEGGAPHAIAPDAIRPGERSRFGALFMFPMLWMGAILALFASPSRDS